MEINQDSILAFTNLGITRFTSSFMKIWCDLSEIEFDEVLEGILEKAVDHLEKNANFLYDAGEDEITAFLVAYLNMPGLHALQQNHSKGHVDITIELESSLSLRRRIGEAKIYKGPKYHQKGLEQLISRYLTGRDGFAFIIEYFQTPDIMKHTKNIQSFMDFTKPCNQKGKVEGHNIRWAFVSHHMHKSGEVMRVIHLNCNLYI